MSFSKVLSTVGHITYSTFTYTFAVSSKLELEWKFHRDWDFSFLVLLYFCIACIYNYVVVVLVFTTMTGIWYVLSTWHLKKGREYYQLLYTWKKTENTLSPLTYGLLLGTRAIVVNKMSQVGASSVGRG